MSSKILFLSAALAAVPGLMMMVYGFAPRRGATNEVPPSAPSGALSGVDSHGKVLGDCPLKHTDVKAEISGFIARVNVTQEFQNNFSDKIEAVYTFPLPQDAAVDNMTMIIGDRRITGLIKKRDEAREIYNNARRQGHTASLLDQERPNIFTQSVTNIPPGQTVKIQISYVEMLPYDGGTYSFVFPMVVAPRYNPQGLPDAHRITPPVTPKGTRAGHDISLQVTLDAGVPLDSLECASHPVSLERTSVSQAKIALKSENEIPNKDFVLKYDVLGKKINDAVLTHRDQRGGFFTLMLTPPERPAANEITPKEIVFVVDTSGSMHGFPLDKTKETMRMALDGLNPRDTFNLITFSGDDHVLFPEPVPATRENVERAWSFLAGQRGSGGTEMMKAIRTALDPTDSRDHIRIACFFTDGEVGNDMEIIAEVKKHTNARVFAFGVGSSTNRFLLDNMAKYGRGEVEYVALTDDGSKAAKKFYERVRTPVLTDVQVDWGGLAVSELYPARIPDLFSAKPLVITGRYDKPGTGTIRITGKQAGRPYVREVKVDLAANAPQHDVLATLWARTKIGDLMSQDYAGMQRRQPQGELQEQITKLGLDYRLMTQFTSFVAVEDRKVVEGAEPRVIQVPVEMPEGMSYEGVYGGPTANAPMPVSAMAPTGAAGGFMARRKMASPMDVASAAPTGRPKMEPETAQTMPTKPGADVAKEEVKTANKLHPRVNALLQRVLNQAPAAASEQSFVKNGTAELQVWIADSSPAAIEALKKLGLQVVKPGAAPNQLVCRISIAQLAVLLQSDNIRYVAPLQ